MGSINYHRLSHNKYFKTSFLLTTLFHAKCVSSSISISYKRQNHEKQIDDIKVKIEGRKDIFFGVQVVFVFPAHHQLSVNNDVARENDRSKGGINNIQQVTWKYCAKNAKDHQAQHKYKQDSIAHCKINFGLQGKYCQAQNDQCTYSNGCN